MRSSRRHSSTRALPKTVVYCGGAAFFFGVGLGRLRDAAADDRVGLRGVPLLHPGQAALLGRLEALPLHGRHVHHDGPVRVERVAHRLAHRADVVAVDHADVGQVELLEQEARRPVGLQRLLQDRAEALEALAHPDRQARQRLLDVLARVVELRVQPDAVEVAGQSADVRRDRHAVVVQHDHDRQVQPAGVVERLERDAAGQCAVADDRDDLAVLADAAAHRLLEADRVGDRGRGVAGAHDVVLRLEDRAEGREPLVLADRRELVAAAGEDLVRVGLMADVPEDLVARRLEQAVQGDRQLAGAEVRAEVAADLADRVDDQLADLLRDLLELLVGQLLQVGRAVDLREERHDVRVRM